MEKIDLLRFRALKQEIIDNITKYRMAMEGRLDFSDEDGWADFSDGEGTTEVSDDEDWVDFSDEGELEVLSEGIDFPDDEDWMDFPDEEVEIIDNEELKKFSARYKEIIRILSEHDLSDIDFEEWEGMYLFTINAADPTSTTTRISSITRRTGFLFSLIIPPNLLFF